MSDASSSAAAGAHALASLTYLEVERLLSGPRRSVALLAVGSVEAHGPHLPLATDTLIAERVVIDASRKLAAAGFEAVWFPTIPYTVTEWAAMFAGSLSIPRAMIEELVLETCLAAQRMGFDHVVLANAHLEPANVAMLRSVADRFAQRCGRPLLFVDKTRRQQAARLGEEFRSGSCHAGRYETSLVLAIAPELVDRSRAAALPEHTVALHEEIRAGHVGFLECGLPDAYCGAPAEATAEEGRHTLDLLSDMVLEAVLAADAATPAGDDR